GDVKRLTSMLGGDDAVAAQRAVWQLAAAPKESVPLLRERLFKLRDRPRADQTVVDRLLVDLDSDDFTVRDRAAGELEKLGGTGGAGAAQGAGGQAVGGGAQPGGEAADQARGSQDQAGRHLGAAGAGRAGTVQDRGGPRGFGGAGVGEDGGLADPRGAYSAGA